jgi:serine/threonine protein kinase
MSGKQPVLPTGSEVAPGYEVLEHLARSRALDVYDVWSVEREARCVAKLLRPDRLVDRSARRRLVQEGRLLRRLSHPHVVRLYETVTEPLPALILEALPGDTLERLLEASTRRLPLRDVAILGTHLCAAIQYVHRQGYLHLDLKPSNVVCAGGVAKLLDFSIARPPGRAGRPVGTRPYMAPEQAAGGVLTAATDVWGLGSVLYESATGQRPCPRQGDSGPGGFEWHQGRPSSIRQLRRVPAAFAAVVDASLEPAPKRRPAVGEVARVLKALSEPAR